VEYIGQQLNYASLKTGQHLLAGTLPFDQDDTV
jgi:hypothetical protein